MSNWKCIPDEPAKSMTIREKIATELMAAIIIKGDYGSYTDAAERAVMASKILIEKLNEE